MKKQTGIWLDLEKAIVIILNENGYDLKTIVSDIETKERFDGESKLFGRFGSQFLSKENKAKRRIKEQTNKYLKKLLSEIKNVDEIVLFGPASVKVQLKKLILSDNVMSVKLKGVESADAMTQNQMISWVKKYYAKE